MGAFLMLDLIIQILKKFITLPLNVKKKKKREPDHGISNLRLLYRIYAYDYRHISN